MRFYNTDIGTTALTRLYKYGNEKTEPISYSN